MLRKLPFLPLLLLALACDSAGGDGAVPCTEIDCNSTLTLAFQHDLALDEAVILRVTTPDHEIRCSIDPEPTGGSSCFGFAFANVEWDADSVTVTLTEPFLATDENPDSVPYETVDAQLELGSTVLVQTTVTIEAGEPDTPNGPDCPPTCWQATGSADLTF